MQAVYRNIRQFNFLNDRKVFPTRAPFIMINDNNLISRQSGNLIYRFSWTLLEQPRKNKVP